MFERAKIRPCWSMKSEILLGSCVIHAILRLIMIKVIFWPLIWVVLSLMLLLLWLLFYLNWKNISHTFSIFLACCSKKIIFIFFFLLDRISILNIIKYSQWKWHFLVILKFQRGLYSHIVERIDTLLTAFESLMISMKTRGTHEIRRRCCGNKIRGRNRHLQLRSWFNFTCAWFLLDRFHLSEFIHSHSSWSSCYFHGWIKLWEGLLLFQFWLLI